MGTREWLNVEEGGRVHLEVVREPTTRDIFSVLELSDVNGPKHISFNFISALSYRHWDEISLESAGGGGPLADPARWKKSWPTGMSIEALTSMLPALLKDVPLCHGRAIAITALQVTYLFRVDFAGGGVWCVGSKFLKSQSVDKALFDIHIPKSPSMSRAGLSTTPKSIKRRKNMIRHFHH